MTAVTLLNEEWRSIPAVPRYEASTLGRIRSPHGRILKMSAIGKGYLIFGYWDSEKQKTRTRLVSRSVLEAFVGPAPDGMQACHGNGDKSDNGLSNLRWDTQKGNEADKVAHGTLHYGERHYKAKLSNEDVRRIKEDTRMHKEIASEFGVSRSHVSSIKCGCFRVMA